MPFRHLAAVAAEIETIASRFEEAGHRLYLVGGIVRDQWLDQPLGVSADIDLTTDAPPTRTRELVADLADALWTQGERFGTIGLQHGGHAIEITTHRAESYAADSRKPQVSFGDDIAVDLSRRDFTVNAMAVRVPGLTLVDPWGGQADLADQRLRTPLDPLVSFGDDPLRMLRAARFSAKYDLEPTAELIDAARTLHERLRIVAIERIGDELRRLFALERSAPGLHFLVDTGLASQLLGWQIDEPSELDPALLGEAADRVDAVHGSWTSRLAAFLLVALESPARVVDAVERLRLSRGEQRRVTAAATGAAAIIELHDAQSTLDDPVLRRWAARRADPDAAIAVAVGIDARSQAFEAAWRTLRSVEDPSTLTVLDGAVIMTELELDPGPVVGEAVAMLRETLFDRGPLPPAAQIEVLHGWWATRDTAD